MQIITIAAIKGGTGKTTTTAALAQAAAADNKKVLAIDLDPQANLTYITGGELNQAGSYALLHGADVQNVIQNCNTGIDLIAGQADLSLEQSSNASASRLKEAIEPIKKKYDFIFIDTPPIMGELTYNALYASTGLLIPLEADINSIQGLYFITDIAKQIQQTNTGLKIKGTILTRYDNRANINKYFLQSLEDIGKEIKAPFLAAIRPGVAVKEAQARRKSLFEYAPGSNPAKDYQELYTRIKRK